MLQKMLGPVRTTDTALTLRNLQNTYWGQLHEHILKFTKRAKYQGVQLRN